MNFMKTTPLPSPRWSNNNNNNNNNNNSSNNLELPFKMSDPSGDSDLNLTSSTSTSSSSTSLLACPICHKELTNPHMLPCLHVFCLACLRDECQGKSMDKYFCPLCVVDEREEAQKSHLSRIWHSYERIQKQENGSEELHRRLAELPASEGRVEPWDKDSNDSSSEGGGETSDSHKKSSILEPPMLFPCSMHPDRLADTFCLKCDQLACHKCVSSFHRRCQNFSGLQNAVDAKRRQFDSIHDKMADNLVACEDAVECQQKRLQEIEDMRTEVLLQIKTFRTGMVNAILTKEKLLTQEANHFLDSQKEEANSTNVSASKMANSLRRQMELLDLSFSVKGEAELLPLLPGLSSRIDNDAKLIKKQDSIALTKVSFLPDLECKSVLDASDLGKIHIEGAKNGHSKEGSENGNDVTESQQPDLNLSLVTSFHGGSREDESEPLLTDLIVVANGDVILTDRDNKCVKKFNQTGKLLTRVLLDAVPSRIATVSHARAVVSVMNKKSLYFLSLFGTVRVLHTVKVKKLYSFLTSLGDGLLAAGTNLCESIDVLNEKGETIRSIFTQKPEKASISRPLYLTPVIPHSSVFSSIKDEKDAISDSCNIKSEGNIVPQNDANSRRASANENIRNSANNSNNNQTIPTKGLSSNSSSSKNKSSKKHPKKNVTSSSVDTSISSSVISSLQPLSFSDQAILVSDSGRRVMFRLQRDDGAVAYSLKSSDQLTLECPLGVTVHERGLTLLVDRDSDCVLLLDKDGKFLKKILSPKEGIVKPCGIYAGLKGAVALSQVDGTVKIYKTVK